MSTTLEPKGDDEPEGASSVLSDPDADRLSITLKYDIDEQSSAMPEARHDAPDPPIREPAVEPVDAPSEPSTLPSSSPSSPSPLYLLPEPAATDGDAEASASRRAAALGLPTPRLVRFTDLGLRSAPVILPLVPSASLHTPLLPAPAPLPPAPPAPRSDEASIGSAALPVFDSADPSLVELEPASLAPADPLSSVPSVESALALPTLAPDPREAPALVLPALEDGAPQLPEPSLPAPAAAPELPELPVARSRPSAAPPESASLTAPAAIATALAAIVSARVAAAPLRVTPLPAPRTPTPTAPLPSRASVPRRRRPVERHSVPARPRQAKARRWSILGTTIKVALFAIELPLALMLATYAGVIPLLPPTPPAARVDTAGGGVAVQAQLNLYCWFTPGHGRCSAPPAVPTQALPKVRVHRGGVLQFTFNYPAPTSCAASILDSASTTGAMKSLGSLRAQADAMMLAPRTYRLQVALAPGTYSLDVSCRWHPPQSLRWLQGQGESSYWVALSVLPS